MKIHAFVLLLVVVLTRMQTTQALTAPEAFTNYQAVKNLDKEAVREKMIQMRVLEEDAEIEEVTNLMTASGMNDVRTVMNYIKAYELTPGDRTLLKYLYGWAVRANQFELLEVLLQYYSDYLKENNSAVLRYVLDIIFRTHNFDAYTLIYDWGIRIPEDYHYFAPDEQVEVIRNNELLQEVMNRQDRRVVNARADVHPMLLQTYARSL